MTLHALSLIIMYGGWIFTMMECYIWPTHICCKHECACIFSYATAVVCELGDNSVTVVHTLTLLFLKKQICACQSDTEIRSTSGLPEDRTL